MPIVLAGTTGDAVLGQTYYANHPEVLSSAPGLVREIARGAWERGVTLPRFRVGRAHGADRHRRAGLALRRKTILADKANEFYQPARTGDAAPPSPRPAVAARSTRRRAGHPFERAGRMALSAKHAWRRVDVMVAGYGLFVASLGLSASASAACRGSSPHTSHSRC